MRTRQRALSIANDDTLSLKLTETKLASSGARPDVASETISPLRLAFRTLRIRQWFHFLGLPLLAQPPWRSTGAAIHALRLVTATASALAFAYAVNAVSDRGSDRSTEKNPLAGRDALPSVVTMTVVATAVLPFLLVGREPVPLGCTAVSILASTLYSVGPRLKRLPVLGTLVNVPIFVPFLWAGEPQLPPPRSHLVVSVVCVALLLQNQLIHELADRDEDAVGGTHTTAQWLGVHRTRASVVGLAVANALAVLELRAPAPIATLAIVSPAVTLASLAASDPGRSRLAHRGLSLLAGIALAAAVWSGG